MPDERKDEGMKRNEGKRKLYYISAEFLIGKLLSNNLINLGLFDEVRDILEKYGKDIAEIEESSRNRLSATAVWDVWQPAFWILIATLGLYGDGVGLNYHDGLFRQTFVDHKQKEEKNP